jgi:hypothetical protein
MGPEPFRVFTVSTCKPLLVVKQVLILALFPVPIDMRLWNKKLKCHKNQEGSTSHRVVGAFVYSCFETTDMQCHN